MPKIVYCIGAQKAGTSWLFYALQQSGAVAFPFGKEAHYWDWLEQGKRPRNDQLYWTQLLNTATQYSGDFTPGYSILQCQTIQQIYAAQPDIQVVFLMRDPIDRAWSAARMAAEYARLSESEISDSWLEVITASAESQLRGDYACIIRNWLEVIPFHQFHLLGFGDIHRHPEKTFHWLTRKLGLPEGSVTVPSQLLRMKFNASRPRAMPLNIRESLAEMYAPKLVDLNECLTDFGLQFDLERWEALF